VKTDNPPLDANLTALLLRLGLSTQAIIEIAKHYDEPTILRHARQTEWLDQQGKVYNPPGWLIASLRGNFKPPHGFPLDLVPSVLTFRLDGETYAVVQRIEKVEDHHE
jgi:hypothetical protein